MRLPYGFSMGLSTGTRLFGQATAPPTGTATHDDRGDVRFNALPSPGGFAGWICTASGAPGTWNGLGAISP
jgi:hypothetical protein